MLWTWAFAFAFSASYFRYNRCPRVIAFAAAMFGVVVLPWGAWRQLVRGGPPLGAITRQILTSVLSLGPLAVASYVLARVPRPCRLSGDDAMGVGIDFLLLSGVGVVSVLTVGGVAMARRRRRR